VEPRLDVRVQRAPGWILEAVRVNAGMRWVSVAGRYLFGLWTNAGDETKRNLKRRSRARCTDEIASPKRLPAARTETETGMGMETRDGRQQLDSDESSSNGDDLPSNAVWEWTTTRAERV